MSIERARRHLASYGLEEKIRELPLSSATVELAAQAVGVEKERIAKTLSFWVGQQPILIVTAGDAKIDNARYKAKFQTKAKMLAHDEVEAVIGHEVGGVCPFGVREGIRVYLDISLKRFATVFPACGSHNSAIELNLEQLERCSQAKEWVNVCKGWRESEE